MDKADKDAAHRMGLTAAVRMVSLGWLAVDRSKEGDNDKGIRRYTGPHPGQRLTIMGDSWADDEDGNDEPEKVFNVVGHVYGPVNMERTLTRTTSRIPRGLRGDALTIALWVVVEDTVDALTALEAL